MAAFLVLSLTASGPAAAGTHAPASPETSCRIPSLAKLIRDLAQAEALGKKLEAQEKQHLKELEATHREFGERYLRVHGSAAAAIAMGTFYFGLPMLFAISGPASTQLAGGAITLLGFSSSLALFDGFNPSTPLKYERTGHRPFSLDRDDLMQIEGKIRTDLKAFREAHHKIDGILAKELASIRLPEGKLSTNSQERRYVATIVDAANARLAIHASLQRYGARSRPEIERLCKAAEWATANSAEQKAEVSRRVVKRVPRERDPDQRRHERRGSRKGFASPAF